MPSVLWLRRDLRRHDNPALLAALDAARAQGDRSVVALFVLDPRLWGPAGDARRAWLARSLSALDQTLGGALLVRHGDPVELVPQVAAAAGARTVHVAADFAPYGSARDRAVEAALADAGRALVRSGSAYAVSPGRVRKGDGSPYRVYTPFLRAWREHGWRAPAPDPDRWPDWHVESTGPLASDGRPTAPAGVARPDAGEAAARRRWAQFRGDGLDSYGERRDRADLDDSAAHTGFVRQLAWRDFYADVLDHTPGSARTWLDPRFAAMEHDAGPEADDRFEAWCAGRTGFPFVDAGMRQLLAEGVMHNRLRMVTASFLVKDLHLPWQRGARWFMQRLRDGDLASNQLGWQWVAGSGTDAAPYFRVFNPVAQGLRFDPLGDYVRRYVPELRELPGPAAHEPWKHPLLAASYPEAILEHAEERAESLRRFAALKAAQGTSITLR